MEKLRRVESAESSSATDFGSYRTRLGMCWLSLNPPKSFQCPLCEKSFPSLQALGGHQNAHRKERKEMYKQYVQEYLENRELSPALSPSPLKPIPSHSPTVYQNPYGTSLGNPYFLPCSFHPKVCDELTTRKTVDAGADLQSKANAKSFAYGTDESEVTSKTELDLSLKLSL